MGLWDDKYDYIVACHTHGVKCATFPTKSFTVDETALLYEDERRRLDDGQDGSCETMIYRSTPSIDVWRPAR